MTSERAHAYIERMTQQLDQFDRDSLSLQHLMAQLEALLGLLLDEADTDWVGGLEAECNRLEFSHAAAVNDQRDLSEQEEADVRDAIRQMRLMLKRY